MSTPINIEILAKGVQQIYSSEPQKARNLVEGFLNEELADLTRDERLELLATLMDRFKENNIQNLGGLKVDEEVLSRIFSFLLGKSVSPADLSSSELLNRLADSLNTIFDSLNQLVSVINRTFLGQQDGLETIRQVIGFHLEGSDHIGSLESYLGQISKAFLAAQEAFKSAAEKKMKEVLEELDPEKISGSIDGSFKLGRSVKADSFEIYTEKYKALKKWVDSGRYMQELLRDFENSSQKIFLK